MPELFLELFSEEVPAGLQAEASSELFGICRDVLAKLSVRSACSFYGPRRLSYAATIDEYKHRVQVEIRGPRETAPEQALKGFLSKQAARREDLAVEAGYYVLRKTEPSLSCREVVEAELGPALSEFHWRKSMRWGGSGDFSWIRPLRRIVCLLDDEVVPIRLGPVTAGDVTEGHRVMGGGAFTVTSAADWQEKLRDRFVIADPDERQAIVEKGLAEAVQRYGISLAEDNNLIFEVSGLVEWPVALIGKIDQEFMVLPPEVRELSMRVNQKYFSTRDAEGQPASYFAFVANLEAEDGGDAIIAGNERVLRARLADARHFWEMDLKAPLNWLLPKLESITFHARIGSQRQRAERIAALATQIAKELGAGEFAVREAEIAGRLCKADLVTGMVGEFPELQGVMGGYYAERAPHGWDGHLVGAAIKTHYQPKGPTDAVPRSSQLVAEAVALADKLDTLREFFRIGERPTGSGDPYALRRAALGVIRIVLENELRLDLKALAGDDGVFGFLIERLRVKLRGEGKRFDVLDAVLAAGEDGDLMRLMRRVDALTAMLTSEDGRNLLAAYKRAGNILAKEEARDGTAYYQDYDVSIMTEPAERALAASMDDLGRETATSECGVEDLLSKGHFEEAVTLLAKLRQPIDAFFNEVTVNTEDQAQRANRLRLLSQFIDRVDRIGNLARIEG